MTDPDPRLERLKTPPLKTEAETIRVMIAMYCRARHGGKALCEECAELEAYALKRLACCPFGEAKPVCGKCRIHCYKPAMRERIAVVMRFAGPRLMLSHPMLSLAHLWKSLTVPAPEKPRNRAAAARVKEV